jgi:predicted nucleic acid-binding protein
LDLILDTNALSSVAEGDAEIVKYLPNANRILIPVIVLGEYRFGIAQSRDKRHYERWLAGFLPTCTILEITDATTFHYAEIRHEQKRTGTPIPQNDLWIAALCRQHQAPLLSRDRHFDRVAGLKRLS